MGMHKTLKIHIFVMECGTDTVSFYSLSSQLSFDTKQFMYKNSHNVKHCGFLNSNDL